MCVLGQSRIADTLWNEMNEARHLSEVSDFHLASSQLVRESWLESQARPRPYLAYILLMVGWWRLLLPLPRPKTKKRRSATCVLLLSCSRNWFFGLTCSPKYSAAMCYKLYTAIVAELMSIVIGAGEEEDFEERARYFTAQCRAIHGGRNNKFIDIDHLFFFHANNFYYFRVSHGGYKWVWLRVRCKKSSLRFANGLKKKEFYTFFWGLLHIATTNKKNLKIWAHMRNSAKFLFHLTNNPKPC